MHFLLKAASSKP